MDLFRLLLTLPNAAADDDDDEDEKLVFVWLSKSDQKTSRVLLGISALCNGWLWV